MHLRPVLEMQRFRKDEKMKHVCPTCKQETVKLCSGAYHDEDIKVKLCCVREVGHEGFCFYLEEDLIVDSIQNGEIPINGPCLRKHVK